MFIIYLIKTSNFRNGDLRWQEENGQMKKLKSTEKRKVIFSIIIKKILIFLFQKHMDLVGQ